MDQNLGGIPRKYDMNLSFNYTSTRICSRIVYAQSCARYHQLNKLQRTGLKSNTIYNNTIQENVSEIPNKL